MSQSKRIADMHASALRAQQAKGYIGRFAPSPSGPLHFGSLVCALASFLHARKQQGKWLVRIEDIDTPRIDASMNSVILNTLQTHGLQWDDEVVYQSERHALYEAYLSKINAQNLLYACACSRKQIRQRSGTYDGHCRNLALPFDQCALRFKHLTANSHFVDLFLGKFKVTHPIATEDPVLKRADGIYAYHLAVVVDDIEQKVNHIVRGYDLFETSPVHLSLFQAFDASTHQYLHVPIIVQAPNQKLSKQHHSPSVDNHLAIENIRLALRYIGVSSALIPKVQKVEQLIAWAIDYWQPNLMPKQTELLISTTNGVYSACNDKNQSI